MALGYVWMLVARRRKLGWLAGRLAEGRLLSVLPLRECGHG